MDKQKRFKKQELKSDDYKGMEQGAKALRRGICLTGFTALIIKNRNNLKNFGKSALKLAGKVIKM